MVSVVLVVSSSADEPIALLCASCISNLSLLEVSGNFFYFTSFFPFIFLLNDLSPRGVSVYFALLNLHLNPSVIREIRPFMIVVEILLKIANINPAEASEIFKNISLFDVLKYLDSQLHLVGLMAQNVSMFHYFVTVTQNYAVSICIYMYII